MNQHGENIEAAVLTASVLAALTHIDNVGFHGIATNLTSASPKIDRNWSGLIRNARIAVAAIDWPDEIRSAAERFTVATGQLICRSGCQEAWMSGSWVCSGGRSSCAGRLW